MVLKLLWIFEIYLSVMYFVWISLCCYGNLFVCVFLFFELYLFIDYILFVDIIFLEYRLKEYYL